ncbi:MAG: outer membrane beta-barrel protein [Alistipes sp.]|nr:outer membrane beta-barrel protein [Alistipes sp.]
MTAKKIILIAVIGLASLCTGLTAQAQHLIGLSGGAGTSSVRFYPLRESKSLTTGPDFGLSWRYYSLPRFVGAVGADLELLQRGFSYGYSYTSTLDDEGVEQRDYNYYNRKLRSIMLPLVWQPHFYVANNHLRVYLEAAFTISYNFGGDYSYSDQPWSGKYDWRLERDNRWGYGLAGGGGFALLFGRYELGLRARYYFGYADLLKNMNKYYDNATDGKENPFTITPMRSPLDNMTLNLTLGYRMSKDGYKEWEYKPRRKDKNRSKFNFQQSSVGGGSSSSSNTMRR